MAMPEIKRGEAERDLKDFCKTFVPAEYSNELRYSHRFRGNDVTLFEERPPWRKDMTGWSQVTVARFRSEHDCNGWSVCWQRANGRWLPCDWIGETARFGEALEEVKRDRHGTFFG